MFVRSLQFGIGALVTFGALAVHPTWARSIGADVWNVPSLEEQMDAARDEWEQLESADAEVLHRIAVKEAIIADLLAGRMNLAEATERFTELNAPRSDLMVAIRSLPGATDREKMAHNVIAYATYRVGPDQRTATATRLEAERVRMFGALPAP